MKVKTENDIPKDWDRLTARKKTTVRIRPSNGEERFKVSWQDAELVSDPDLDYIVIQPNGKEYPCKKDIFMDTYTAKDLKMESAVGMQVDTWIKKATSTLIRIPEGEDVEIQTLEGVLPKVSYPDFIVVGVQGELYANTKEFVDDNLEIL